MTTFDSLHPRVGDGTFTNKIQSSPDVAISPAGRTLAALPVGTDAARAVTVAAAGGHHSMFFHDSTTEGTVDELVAEIARLSGDKAVIVLEPGVTVTDLIGRSGEPGLLEQANGAILHVRNATEHTASVLDLLRSPLETDRLQYARGGVHVDVPTRFQVVLTASSEVTDANGHPAGPAARRRHFSRISGPLLDRMDSQTNLTSEIPEIDAESLDESIAMARLTSATRLEGTPWKSNADVPGQYLRTIDRRLAPAKTQVLDRALERGGITMRGYDSTLRKAWTLSDIAGSMRPSREHVETALRMRRVQP
jgi:predicted ATPase with chaperone activity